MACTKKEYGRYIERSMTLWEELISLEVASPNLVPTLKALLGSRDDLKATCKLAGPQAQRVVDFMNQVRIRSLISR